MIRTDRLHIIPLNYPELVSRVYSFSGMISNKEEQENVIQYTLIPMDGKSDYEQLFYTFWIGYFNGEEVLECGFLCPPTIHNVVELFCYTRKEFQNKGFGTEAIKGLLRFSEAFENIRHVCASIEKGNLASQKIFKKNGFDYLTDTPQGMMVFNKQIKN